jgi:lactoylglutathione lyase
MIVDDAADVYAKAMAWGCESVMEPTQLERWPVTVAFILDPDGYTVELLQHHQDTRKGAV